ncbi:MAG: type II toxin-antitoxin system VapC family toxin [Rhodothermales bacterium]
MIVADVNLLAYLHIPSPPLTSKALRAYRKDAAWFVPPLWRSEFRNILATYVRSKDLQFDAYDVAWAKRTIWSASDTIGRRVLPVDDDEVLEAAARYRITAYDAEYAVLADLLGVHVVTTDRAFAASGHPRVVELDRFLEI